MGASNFAREGRGIPFLTVFIAMTFFLLTSSAYGGSTVSSQMANGQERYRVIVGKKEQSDGNLMAGAISQGGEASSESVETEVRYFTEEEMREYEKRGDVSYVEKDRILRAVRTPGDRQGEDQDQFYYRQWALTESAVGFRAEEAWDLSVGSSQTVVAVLDTGITDHSDLNDNVLPGADLISDESFANDGDGRDSNAQDPGDWVEEGDRCYSWDFRPSSWHGTHVAGIIGAKGANGIGVSGVSWNAKILPVRVLGKCGGLVSDIADGILWAAGINVSGLPSNPNPADVINLSLGGLGTCGPTLQNAIDRANDKGVVVVAASGNEGYNLSQTEYSPANCYGVLTVGALNKSGNFTSYSNYGEPVDVAAPGGDSSFDADTFEGVFSTHNDGQTTPGNESYEALHGTSMAAPHVSGLAALIKSVKPGLYPAQIRSIIRQSSLAFSSCSAQNGECGEGRVDAYQALVQASQTQPDEDFIGNEPVRAPSDDDAENFASTDHDSGAGCGTIVDSSNGPGGGGSAAAMSFFLLIAMGMLCSASVKRWV